MSPKAKMFLTAGIISLSVVPITVTDVIARTPVSSSISSDQLIPSNGWDKLEEKAVLQAHSGNYVSAVSLIQQAIKLAQEDSSSNGAIFVLYQKLISYARVLQAIDVEIKAVEGLIATARKANQQQAIEDGLMALANLEYEVKDYERAAVHLNELIPMVKQNRGMKFPGLIRAYQLLGASYLKLGKIKESNDCLALALNLEHSTKELGYEASIGLAHAHLGALLISKGQLRKAATHLQTAQAYQLDLPKNSTLDPVQIELSHYPIQELIGTVQVCDRK